MLQNAWQTQINELKCCGVKVKCAQRHLSIHQVGFWKYLVALDRFLEACATETVKPLEPWYSNLLAHLNIKSYLYTFLNIRHTSATDPSVKRQFFGSACNQNSEEKSFQGRKCVIQSPNIHQRSAILSLRVFKSIQVFVSRSSQQFFFRGGRSLWEEFQDSKSL